MENIKSDLQIKKVYFSDLMFKRSELIEQKTNIHNSMGVEYEELSVNEITVKLKYEAKSDDMSISVIAVINGTFVLTNYQELQQNVRDYILRVNTIAILMPYLRSQVVLLTSQPGFNPIQIPIINAELLYNTSQNKGNF